MSGIRTHNLCDCTITCTCKPNSIQSRPRLSLLYDQWFLIIKKTQFLLNMHSFYLIIQQLPNAANSNGGTVAFKGVLYGNKNTIKATIPHVQLS